MLYVVFDVDEDALSGNGLVPQTSSFLKYLKVL